MNTHPQKRDPTVGEVLLLIAGIVLVWGYFKIPPDKLLHLKIALSHLETIGTLILSGIVYGIFLISRWARLNLSLQSPGQTLAAMQKKKQDQFISIIRYASIFIFSFPASFFFTTFLTTQSKILAYCIGWPGSRPWWIPGFLFLLPFSFCIGDIVWSLSTKLWLQKESVPNLLPFPEKGGAELSVTLGTKGEECNQPEWVSFNEKDILKSMIITGGVGFGKTQLIFRILDQLFAAFEAQAHRKISFLILDPKGDMVPTIRELANQNGRGEDLLFIGINHPTTWNPLYFPDVQLSGRFRDVAERFKAAMINYQGGGSSDPFWIESGTNLLGWLIWLSATALGDVTFGNLYKLLLACSSSDPQAQGQGKDPLDMILKAAEAKILALEGDILKEQEVNIETCKLYLGSDFRKMPDKTRMNVVANLSSFLQLFLTAEAQRMFSPKHTDATFGSMREVIDQGKILILDMTQNDRPGLCRAVGTFLKLSYQNAIMSRLADGQKPERLACLVLDEYQNFATSSHGETQFGDDRFFDQCRAAKGFGIIATQSYATLTMVFKKEAAAQELLGQIAHKITFATDEPSTCAYFRRLAGKKWVKRHSESISESSSNARRLWLQNDLQTEKSSVGLSYSTSEVEVDTMKDEDIAKLPPFKAYSALKLADGPQTDYLYTRPLFDPKPHLLFKDMTLRLCVLFFFLVPSFVGKGIVIPPNVCEAINSASVDSCFGIQESPCKCTTMGIPHPCTRVTYWVPKTFVEVSPRIGDSYFSMIPIVQKQLLAGVKSWNWTLNKMGSLGTDFLNVGVVDDNGSSFFHIHTVPVLLGPEVLKGLPCGSPGYSTPCLTAMSEHHPAQWATGYFDLKQPQLYAGAQMCGGGVEMVTSLVQSSRSFLDGPIGNLLSSAGMPDFEAPDDAGCSLPLAATLNATEVSGEPPCLGSLGAIFPRYGTVNGPTNVSGALSTAYKFRTLASEQFKTVVKNYTEKWQMIRPKATGCFYPGENLFSVEGLFTPAIRDQFLFLVWEKRSCCVNHFKAGFARGFLAGVKAMCKIIGSK